MFADPDDPEYVRQMRRPAEVKEDIRQMEQRKRVDLIMQVYSMHRRTYQLPRRETSYLLLCSI